MHYKQNNKESKTYVQGLRPFGNTLPRGIKGVLKKSGYNYGEIISKWKRLVGKEISNNCYPLNIKAQGNSKEVLLLVNVVHGKEIEVEYNKKNIIDKINTYFGYTFINNIQIKIMDTKYTKSKKDHITKIKTKIFDDYLKNIENKNLKNKLENLIDAFNEKR